MAISEQKANDLEMNIRLEKDGTSAIVQIKEDGKALNKTISIEELVAKLSTNFTISTGLLPRGTRIFAGAPEDYKIGIEIPAGIRPIYFIRDGKFKEKVPFPAILMVFRIQKTNVHESSAFALSGPITSLNNSLCKFPFGNTYDDGRICWGGVKLPKIKEPIDILSCVSSFMDSEYNGDLYNDRTFDSLRLQEYGIKFTKHSIAELLHYIKDKEFFPSELLKSCGLTISNVTKERH